MGRLEGSLVTAPAAVVLFAVLLVRKLRTKNLHCSLVPAVEAWTLQLCRVCLHIVWCRAAAAAAACGLLRR